MLKIKITTKLIFWFLLIALLPMTAAIYVSYNSSRRVLKEEINKNLLTMTDNKAFQIEVFLSEKKKNLINLSRTSDIIYAIEKYQSAGSDGYDFVDNEFRPFLIYHQKVNNYTNLFLVNPDGDILFSAGENGDFDSLYKLAMRNKFSQLADVFIRINKSRETEISSFEYDQASNSAAVFIGAPVFKGGNYIGLIIAQMDNSGLFKFTRDYTGLGRTGEVVIVSRINEEISSVIPLRFDPDASFKRKFDLSSDIGLVLDKALKHEDGSKIFKDYRGNEVLGVWRHLSTFNLGMVVKIDTNEVFLPAEDLRTNLIKISMLLMVVVVSLAVLTARSISKPIKLLTQTSRTISKGDLKARAGINSGDEIGELAQTFNQMTDNLLEAKAKVEEKKEELEQQKALLEEVNEELDRFVYTASHDLRAPLRGIASFAKFLDEDYKEKIDAEGREFIDEIIKGSSRMNKLIDDLLALSRISRIKNPYEEISSREIIDTVVERIKFDIENSNTELIIDDNLPMIVCDRIKLTEVFLNLINNAIKFSSKNNTERPRVEIGYVKRPLVHEFFVKDNGIGIAEEFHDKVFGIFSRLHTESEYEGTGAGLCIAKKVIDDHGGKIWIKSEPGKGAEFHFSIPKSLAKAEKGQKLIAEETGQF
ncbi:MAG: HAMP domain-containing protein [Candidatus Omnitrophica bacterium]|nr:HAMP domain-containing protein [Candidatus Omnitrophota bacterium]